MNILMLHDVRPFDENFFPKRYKQHSFITDDEFVNGIRQLEKDIINFDIFINEFESSYSSINDNKYVLTFDDGLKDHVWVAEYLSSKNIAAAFFIPIGILREKSFIHSHLIQFLIASGELQSIAIDLYKLLRNDYKLHEDIISSFKISKWKNNLWSDEEVFITRVLREFFSYHSRDHLLNSLCEKYLTIDLSKIHSSFYLTLEDLHSISRMGHFVGSHGYYSLDLRYETHDIVESEISKSLNFLNDYNNFKAISFPNGGFSDLVRREASNAGFQYGFGTTHRPAILGDDRMNLPRLDGTKLGIFK